MSTQLDELHARDDFEQEKVRKSADLVAELTARAEAKTHRRYQSGASDAEPIKGLALTDAGKHVLELQRRIARALELSAGYDLDDEREHSGYIARMRNVLRGKDEWNI